MIIINTQLKVIIKSWQKYIKIKKTLGFTKSYNYCNNLLQGFGYYYAYESKYIT